MFFFWYKPEEQQRIVQELRSIGREDLLHRLFPRGTMRQIASQRHPENYQSRTSKSRQQPKHMKEQDSKSIVKNSPRNFPSKYSKHRKD